jgi:acyl-CoA hydrolase
MGPDANSSNVHGGVIMKMVDEAGALVAMRHARAPVVTVAVDSMSFMKPIYVGSLVMCEAELTYVGTSSMEVRVEVHTESPLTGEKTITNTAYLVYVALSDEGKPAPVPDLVYDTPEQIRRANQARERRLIASVSVNRMWCVCHDRRLLPTRKVTNNLLRRCVS